MTEKVKVTREQAEAIEMVRGDTNKGLTTGNIITQLRKQWMFNPYNTLNELTTEQFLVATLGDYEVEESFEVGDWVVTKVTNHIGKITGFSNIPNYYDIEGIQTDNIRHATPEEIAEEKERRWWKKHGRDVLYLKKVDLLKNTHNYLTYEVVDVNEKG